MSEERDEAISITLTDDNAEAKKAESIEKANDAANNDTTANIDNAVPLEIITEDDNAAKTDNTSKNDSTGIVDNLVVVDVAKTINSQTKADSDTGVVDSSEKNARTEKADNQKSIESSLNRRIRGYLALASAVLVLMLSAYLFYNTRGTRLLFVNVTLGRISRYYWIGPIISLILALTGWLTLKHKNRTARKADTKKNASAEPHKM